MKLEMSESELLAVVSLLTSRFAWAGHPAQAAQQVAPKAETPTIQPVVKPSEPVSHFVEKPQAPLWTREQLSAASTANASMIASEPEYLMQPHVEGPAAGSAASSEALPKPQSADPNFTVNLPELGGDYRVEVWKVFSDLVELWLQNFDQEGPQPDRLDGLRSLGSGRFGYGVIIIAYEMRSLQRVVEKALLDRKLVDPTEAGKSARLDLSDKIAANMIQICHLVFPDLAGTYDYSSKWRRG